MADQGPNVEEPYEDAEDTSCCGRATCCNVRLCQVSVDEPIFKPLGQSVTWSSLFWLISCLIITAMVWATLYFLIGSEMLPGGGGWGLFFLVVAAYALGWSFAYLPYLNLPPVFGMLLAGIIFRNTGIYNIQEKIGFVPITKVRTFCLTFVTLRAGLQLTTTPIQRHPFFLLALALLPCTIEMLAVAVCARYVLDYPWDWAFLTGSIIACMSPVVTVNCILALADKGYGEDKGIATLLCIASSVDDVHIVSLYSICFSIVFSVDASRTEWWTYLPGGFRDIVLGFIVGSVLGITFIYFPHRTAKYVSWYRMASVVFGGVMCTTAASTIAITGGGFLATIVMSFIATTGWRMMTTKFDISPMRSAIFFIWHFMQPVLVGVIGADIDFSNWPARRFGLYVVCILVGLMTRSLVAILTTYRTPLNTKERVFVALSWLSKGTLQAALAPMVYEHARLEDTPERLELAMDVIRISVVSVIFLAPLSAIIMMISGPLLLNKITHEESKRERLLSALRVANQLQPVFAHKRRAKGPLENN